MNTHRHMHWGVLVVVSFLVGNFLVGQIHKTYLVDFSANKAEASGSLLTTSDLTCAGVFLTPGFEQGTRGGHSLAMRYENGNRHYFVYTNGHIAEFPEPTLSPCNTPLTGVTRANWESWGADWGAFDVNAGQNRVPGESFVFAGGLFYDDVTSQLILNWSNTYSISPPHNSFAAVTLNNNTHTMSRVGCWAITGVVQSIVGGGVLNIPSSFVSANLPAGARWGVGWGGAAGSYVGLSLGPTLIAVPPPGPNPCAPNTDTFIGSGTVLAQYPQNDIGPNCARQRTLPYPGGSGTALGCTPTQAPTPPYPAKLALTTYSKDMYDPDWEPYGGTGWFGFNTAFSMGWYDDGVKSGIVVPILAPEGWARTTVLDNPAPTIDNSGYYQAGVFYVPSTSTHDGNNINPGDLIWVQTCKPGVDSNCSDGNNGRDTSFIIVDSVNPATGRIAYHNINADYSDSSNHKAVVGGHVYHGCVYMHGSPTCSRGVYRLQIYNPAQYAEVVHGTRQTYDVTYNEEIDLTPMVPGFGAPSLGGGVKIGFEQHAPISTIPDPQAHQIMIAFHDGNSPGYTVSNAVYVFNVGPNAVTPPVAAPGTPAPAPGPAPAPAPTPTPAGPPLTSPATDNFNRADAATLGANWTNIGQGPRITGNKVSENQTGFTDGIAYWSANSFNADQYSQVTVSGLGYIDSAAVCVRMSGAWGLITASMYCYGGNDASSSISKIRNNVGTTLQALGGLNNGDTIKLEVNGTTLKAYKNGTLMATVTDSAISSGAAGIYFYGTANANVRADNWEGGNISSVVTPSPAPAPNPTPVAGDLDGNGIVNSLDWSIMSSVWFTSNTAADLNHDGIVNSIDFSILNRNWFRSN